MHGIICHLPSLLHYDVFGNVYQERLGVTAYWRIAYTCYAYLKNEAVLLENARVMNGREGVDEISYRGRRRKGLDTKQRAEKETWSVY